MSAARVHTALLLSMVYLLGLSLQIAPGIAQWLAGNGEAAIERQCPLKDQNTTSDFAFNKADSKAEQAGAPSIFIPCLSAQERISSYEGKPLLHTASRIFSPLLRHYQSPYLSRDPFPPKAG